MAITLTFDEIMGFKIMVSMIKATRSVDHELVRSWCARKGISVTELLDEKMKGGTIRDLVETPNVEGDGMVERLQRAGMVRV